MIKARVGIKAAQRVVILIVALAVIGAGLASPDRTVGSASSPFAAISGHPRLFFTAEDLPALRAQALTTHESIWAPIQAFADKQLGTRPPAASPPDEGLRFFRNSGNGLIALAFACVLSEEDRYCDLARTYLLTYAGWEQWSERNQRDLSLAHMLYGSALAYDWLYDRLSPDEQAVVRESLAKWAQRMYEASTQRNEFGWRNWWHKSYLQNHYWVNNSALGMAGLALVNDGFLVAKCTIFPAGDTAVNIRAWSSTTSDVTGTLAPGQAAEAIGQMEGADERVWWHLAEGGWVRADVVRGAEDCQAGPLDPQTWIEQAQDRLAIGQLFLEGIADGSWHEGFNYQGYLLTMSLPFWIAMRDLAGIDLLPHTYLRNYTYWWLYNYLPDASGVLLSFGNLDAGWVNNRPLYSILRFNAQEYGDGHAEWLTGQLIATLGRDSNVYTAPWHVFEYLTYDPTIAPQPPTDLPGSRQFPDLSAVIWRTGWAAGDLLFGLKTGVYGGQFAFSTFVEGEAPWETPCKETHCQLNVGHDHEDTNSFYIYQNGWLAPEDSEVGRHDTLYHNTLLIDGEGQSAPPSDRSWRFPEDFAASAGFLEGTADSAHFNFLAADATQRYGEIEGLRDVTRYVLFIRPDYLVMFDRVEADAPHEVDWVAHLQGGASVEGAWIRGNGENGRLLGIGFAAPQPFVATTGADAIPYVRVRPESPSASVLFASVLYPTDSAGWDARPTITLLDRTSQAAVLRLHPNEASQRVIDVVLAFDQPQSPIDVGPYRFDGRAAVITWGPDSTLEKLFIYGGTSLTDLTAGDQTLIEGLSAGTVFEAIFGGSTVSVSGDLPGEVRLFAPAAQVVTLNGRPHSFARSGPAIVF